MLFYILFILFLLLLIIIKKTNYKYYSDQLMLLTITLVAAIRYNVGFDYEAYYNWALKVGDYDLAYARLEPLNKLILNITWKLDNPQVIFIIYAVLTYPIIYKVIKKHSTDFNLSLLIYITFPSFYLESLSIMRQHLAIAIVFYAVKHVKERNLIRYMLFIFFASLIHSSAIIGIIIYFLNTRKINSKVLATSLIVSFFISDLLKQIALIILPRYMYYLTNSVGVGGDKIFYIINFFALILIILRERLIKLNEINRFYVNCIVIGAVIYNGLIKFGHAGSRGSSYFLVYLILVLPEVIRCFKEKMLLRSLAYCSLILIFILTLFISVRNPEKSSYIPYRTYMYQNNTYLSNCETIF